MVSALYSVATQAIDNHRFSLGHVPDAAGEIARGNPNLIWGWKRDVGSSSRAIYFGGELATENDQVVLQRWYLFYRHRASVAAVERIADVLGMSEQITPHLRSLRVKGGGEGMADLRLELGVSSATDRDRVRRLQLRRPRHRLPDVIIPPARSLDEAEKFLPADLYIGSGVSYEAGLPTLCDMHLAFGVDNAACTQFAVGDEDVLPAQMAADFAAVIGNFCAVHVGALSADATPAMSAIAELRRAGHIRKVFTDNVDNLLAKVGVPFERTRGSGVFNEVYPASFASDRLIVVGVAADRRSLVKQARSKGIEIITVNPCEKVAPMVRHLDYVRPGDPFFRETADRFFHQVLSATTPRAPARVLGLELAAP